MDWTEQQSEALLKIKNWMADPDEKQVFRLFGFAGTGKTTLARHAAIYAEKVMFGAYTGKAAQVMRTKGCDGAKTIHSMIYNSSDAAGGGGVRFVNKEESEIKTADLVIVDEVSMIEESMARDLMSYGKKILVLGDPAQLPPVEGVGYFTLATPDVLLTEIQRQVAENPIVAASMRVRTGKQLQHGEYGALRIIRARDLDDTIAREADQVLVGMNNTRAAWNEKIRQLLGHKKALPEEGEKLVCLRNNAAKGVFNGETFKVLKCHGVQQGRYLGELEGDGGKNVRVAIPCLCFNNGNVYDFRQSISFDYGYALTVHKSQGSEWDNVLLIDESDEFGPDRLNWLYTGITRAAKKLTIVM